MSATFRVAVVGDALMTHGLGEALAGGHISADDLLLAGADVGICNLETLFHDYEHPANAFKGGIWLRCPPEHAGDLKRLGLHMAARANNHALDYGPGGLFTTSAALDHAGVLHTGAGTDYLSSFEPVVKQAGDQSVALVSVCSTLPLGFAASRGRGPIPGRAGVAPLRWHVRHQMDDAGYAQMCTALRVLYGNAPKATSRRIALEGVHIERVDEPDPIRRSVADTEDLEALLNACRQATEVADHVVVSLHSHEHGSDGEQQPADFFLEAAHAAVDGGATLVFGHGPHILRGMEVYRGVPILYSLGNFIFQYNQSTAIPDDARREVRLPVGASDDEIASRSLSFEFGERFWEGITVEAAITSEGCTGLTIAPLTIEQDVNHLARGLPRRLHGEAATELLERFASLSPNIQVTVSGSLGHVDLAPHLEHAPAYSEPISATREVS